MTSIDGAAGVAVAGTAVAGAVGEPVATVATAAGLTVAVLWVVVVAAGDSDGVEEDEPHAPITATIPRYNQNQAPARTVVRISATVHDQRTETPRKGKR